MEWPAQVTPPTAVDGVLHVTILWAVLTCFYIFYISKVETKAFAQQFHKFITDSLGANQGLRQYVSTAQAQQLLNSEQVAALKTQWSQPDAVVATNNRWLWRAAFTALGGLVAVLASLDWSSRFGMAVPFGDIVARNLAIFVCVGAVEVVFFTQVISKYTPAPPSAIVDAAVNAAKKHA